MRFTSDDYQMLWDYDEFVDCYFLQGDDDVDSLRHAEEEQLRLYYTMYESISDESAGFDKMLDVWCAADETYIACTDDAEACERREAIKNDVLSHLTNGLARCGQDRSTVLHGANAIEETLAECDAYLDEIIDDVSNGRVDPDDVGEPDQFDELHATVAELAAALAPSSWLTAWAQHPYALPPFVECLRQLRARQERKRAVLQKRVEQDTATMKEWFEQALAAAAAAARRAGHGDDEQASLFPTDSLTKS